jgi:hypothetical protein
MIGRLLSIRNRAARLVNGVIIHTRLYTAMVANLPVADVVSLSSFRVTGHALLADLGLSIWMMAPPYLADDCSHIGIYRI